MQPQPEDPSVLRRCVRELAALSTLSAVWSHHAPAQIADGLAAVLLRSLPLSFVSIRLPGNDQVFPTHVVRGPQGPLPPEQAATVAAIIDDGSPHVGAGGVTEVANPVGGGPLRLIAAPIGVAGDCGTVFAGSPQLDFPIETDRLIFGVACNQAALVLQQRLSEQQIRQSEAVLSDFFENATIGLHWVGPDGTILRANRAELALLGYSANEYIGRNIADFHVDRDVIDDILRRLHRGERLANVEARMRCQDGSIRHVLIDSSVLRDGERFVHTRCFTRDITEQKRAEEKRLELAAIVESSEDAIISRNLDGVITSWNRGAEVLYGYGAGEMIGRRLDALIPADQADRFEELLERARRGESADHYETARVCKDGRRIDVSLTVSPIRGADGVIRGLSQIARDVTERKREREALKQQTERLTLLWEAASVLLEADHPDGMLRELLARIGPHLGADAYLHHVTSRGRDELQLSSSYGVSPEAVRQLARLESAGALPPLLQSVGIRAFQCNVLTIGARRLGTLTFASRTRDRFDAHEAAFIKTLAHYVTVALERLRLLSELQEGDRRKDEFLAILAHELRNPLAPVRNAIKVLNLKGAQNPDARWGRGIIERQIDHLTRLVDDLLEISRITRNEPELRKRRIDLADAIGAAVEASRPLIEASGHELTVTMPPGPVYVDGDLVRLSQVFLNLLNNAAKYTEQGGRISLTGEVQDDSVTVRVRDTGVGIPSEELPRVFEMFYQIDRSLGRAHGGLGIGLSLARRLVEAHGGNVEARSDGAGKGSEFIVRLPMLAADCGEAEREQPTANAGASTAARILVVDDNRDSADSLALFLRLIGNDVHSAYDGIEAVEAAERLKPDVVLLDIGMPRLSGEDACRRIRSTPWGSDMMLIALTGWGQQEDRRRTAQAGFDAHLVKPIDPAEVMKLLESRRCAPPPANRTPSSSV